MKESGSRKEQKRAFTSVPDTGCRVREKRQDRRRIILRRPLLSAVLCLVAGETACYISIKAESTFCLIAFFFIFYAALKSLKITRKYILFFALGILLLFLSTQYYLSYGENLPAGSVSDVRTERLTARVLGAVQGKDKTILTCKTVTDGRKLRVTCARENRPENLAGRLILFHAKRRKPEPNGNPHCLNRRLYLFSQGFSGETFATDIKIAPEENIPLFYRAVAHVTCLREDFLSVFPPGEDRELARGILFGTEDSLAESTLTAFRGNGTAHILAVSGLHIGILYACYARIRRRWKGNLPVFLFVFFLLLYGTATMWQASVLRAEILVFWKMLAVKSERPYDISTALAGAALFMIVQNPYAVFGAGFIMSFLAVGGLAFFLPHLDRLCGSFFGTMLAVNIALMPYMAFTFNTFTPLSLFINIPVIFLSSIYVPAGTAGFCLFMIGEHLTGTCGQGIGLLLHAAGEAACFLTEGLGRMLGICNRFFYFDGHFSPDVCSPSFPGLVLFYILAFAGASEWFTIEYMRKKFKIIGTVIFLACAIYSVLLEYTGTPFAAADFTFVDVGQGDCMHISHGETDILIDGGGNREYDVGRQVLKPYLLKNGVEDIDLALATHLHTDHYLGLEQLAACFDVRRIETGSVAGETFSVDEDCSVQVLWPLKAEEPPKIWTREQGFNRMPRADAKSGDENEKCSVFLVQVNGVRVMVTGDLTAENEEKMVKAYAGSDALRCDVLKVSHHGSKYSTSDLFLDAVKPRVAVISVGRNNYGHPSPAVIEKLRARDIMVFRTDTDGAVGFDVQEDAIQICTGKEPQKTMTLSR